MRWRDGAAGRVVEGRWCSAWQRAPAKRTRRGGRRADEVICVRDSQPSSPPRRMCRDGGGRASGCLQPSSGDASRLRRRGRSCPPRRHRPGWGWIARSQPRPRRQRWRNHSCEASPDRTDGPNREFHPQAAMQSAPPPAHDLPPCLATTDHEPNPPSHGRTGATDAVCRACCVLRPRPRPRRSVACVLS